MKKAKIFSTTLKNYLNEIAGIDRLSRAEALGGTAEHGQLFVSFYGRPHRISGDGVFDSTGQKADFAVSVVLCRYVLQCPTGPVDDGDWVTYREFRDSGPLEGYFTANVNKIMQTTFAGRTRDLDAACRRLGGRWIEDPGFDLAVIFNFLPRIPVCLRFNDQDDEFPAQATMLFRQSAEKYLDMECLAIGATYLTGTLIRGTQGDQPIV